jgi:hypothetical protein
MSNKIPGMREFVLAEAENRLDDAKSHLLVAIASIKNKSEAKPAIAGIAQQFGDICFLQSEKINSIFLYEISEILDPGSLLAKLDYAKFLFRKIQDKKQANFKCDEIIEQAQSFPSQETESDFSSEQYIDAALRLKQEMNN